MSRYKYYAGLTSQLGFCSTPLRLDSYNRCQFSCAYCYANTRQGFGRDSQFQIANPTSLKQRIERVFSGKISSALDEFISRRIPFQLGGMSDPFAKIEEDQRVSLEYLRILKSYDYPVIISTKSDLILKDEYLEVLSNSNSYVRFSVTVVANEYRAKVDRGCPAIDRIAEAVSAVVKVGVPVSFRLQPILPDHENVAAELISLAADTGAKHISAEYLKIPIDSSDKFLDSLCQPLGGNPPNVYQELGAARRGQEYILPLSYREDYLIEMAKSTRSKGMTFGFADNDLLLHADGDACCHASNLYLKGAGFFTANIVSIAKKKKPNEKIFFADYLGSWIPSQSISTYLNSKSRLNVSGQPDWPEYLKNMWLGKQGVYSPEFFDGIERTDERDDYGFPIFVRRESAFERKLNQ